jgi:hypothetical protein
MPVVPAIDWEDPITPKSVEHKVDAAKHAETGEVLYHYNFLSYRFESSEGEIRARSYLDDIKTASLFLPKGMELSHPDAQRVIAYLSQRYASIQTLGAADYETVRPTPAQ